MFTLQVNGIVSAVGDTQLVVPAARAHIQPCKSRRHGCLARANHAPRPQGARADASGMD
jgi:hypothetical protein